MLPFSSPLFTQFNLRFQSSSSVQEVCSEIILHLREEIENMPPKRKAAKVMKDAIEKVQGVGGQLKMKRGRPAKQNKVTKSHGAKAASKENDIVVEEKQDVDKTKGRRKKATTAAQKAKRSDGKVVEVEVRRVRQTRATALLEKLENNDMNRGHEPKIVIKMEVKEEPLEEVEATKEEAVPEKSETNDMKTEAELKRVIKTDFKEEPSEEMVVTKTEILATKDEVKDEKAGMSVEDEEDVEDTDDDEYEYLIPYDTVFQFTVRLDGPSPKIWRKFQVPSTYTFFELHNAIQCCMGWQNSHLHEFRIRDPSSFFPMMLCIGKAENHFDPEEMLDENEEKIADYFTEYNKKAEYIYDFGDNWVHTLTFHKELPRKQNTAYPLCMSGKFACPLEDIHGIDGHYEFLEIMKNPNHPEYEHYKEWSEDINGSPYDPDKFDAKDVSFNNWRTWSF